jgi:Holliday junction resolvasome RuvABC endonuclease subunit
MPINIIIRLDLAVKQRSGGADPADALALALAGSMMMVVDVEQRRIPDLCGPAS